MNSIIKYFSDRHLLTNAIFFGFIIFAIFVWNTIGKEEMPEFASNWIRVSTIYPGAPAEDVELFVTKVIEEELKGVVGIDEVITTSSVGISSIQVIIDDDYPEKDEVVTEVKDAVLRANLPAEVRDIPSIRQFKSSEKAILDIGIYHKEQRKLTLEGRQELQRYVLGLENSLLALAEVSSIDKSHYRKPELQILIDPNKKINAQISLSEVQDQIRANNIRVPIGSMQDKGESRVTAMNELETVESLQKLFLRGNYEGEGIHLGDLATIKEGFDKTTSIFKINGHEAIFINIKKSVSTDILSAQAAVMNFIQDFKSANKSAPIGIVPMDDESYAVTNRLKIISSNGLLGFFLIVIVLLIFLDAKSGFWVAMGIPFCMAFTLIAAQLMGYTVNNMTLAGIIIVLGIVVDDAIIIAENITRLREEGMPIKDAVVVGTSEVWKAIVASIITTCAAFIPLLFFEGFFGKLVSYIPAIVILMLVGSLLESVLILPAHMGNKTPILEKFVKKEGEKNWFYKYEDKYRRFLLGLFHHRGIFITISLIFLIASGYLFHSKMKFVMFPREESTEVFIKIKAPKGTAREDTSKLIEPLEDKIAKDIDNVVGVRSSIALSRRGGEVRENEASILVEVYPADERSVPLKKLIEDWEEFSKSIKGLEQVKFLKGRWGHGSGSAIELQIQENNDNYRKEISEILAKNMREIPSLADVEIEEPLLKNEIIFNLKQEELIRFGITPSRVTSTLRNFVEGGILYSINKGEEEIDVRLTVPDEAKTDLRELLNLRVVNQQGQLVPLEKVVKINEAERPMNISRTNFKRTTMIYANLADKAKLTPLEVAEKMEQGIFKEVRNKYPTSILSFKGEIEDTRESQGEFLNSIFLVIILIYFILIAMFDSMTKPLVILSIVPFGAAGVVYVLIAHGMSVFGFFAVVGALGMIGVVINDAIVMIDRIETKFDRLSEHPWEVVAYVASTRLRPVLVTTITTVVGILPTAYGFAGYDSMLAEMMLTMGWGLAFGTFITLLLIPTIYTFFTPEHQDKLGV